MKIQTDRQLTSRWWTHQFQVPIPLLTLALSLGWTLPPVKAATMEPQPPLLSARQVTKTSSTTNPKSARDYYNRAMRRYRNRDRIGAQIGRAHV